MKMTRAMPTPFQTSTMATDRSAMLGLDSHCGPSIPTTSSERLDEPGRRVQKHRERDADRDGADEDGKEDRRAQDVARP